MLGAGSEGEANLVITWFVQRQSHNGASSAGEEGGRGRKEEGGGGEDFVLRFCNGIGAGVLFIAFCMPV